MLFNDYYEEDDEWGRGVDALSILWLCMARTGCETEVLSSV